MWHNMSKNKIKAEVSTAWTKTIFMLPTARKLIQSTVTSKQQQNKYLVDWKASVFITCYKHKS